MKQRLAVSTFLAALLAALFALTLPVEAARPRPRPMPPTTKAPCYASVCTWTPIGSFCTVIQVPCPSGPGVVPGNPGGTNSSR